MSEKTKLILEGLQKPTWVVPFPTKVTTYGKPKCESCGRRCTKRYALLAKHQTKENVVLSVCGWCRPVLKKLGWNFLEF